MAKPRTPSSFLLRSIPVWITAVLMAAGFVLERRAPEHPALWVLWAGAYVFGGYAGVRSGLRTLLSGAVDIDILMVLAALGAAWVGAPFEGAMLLFLFSLSNVLQDHALERSRNAVASLIQLRPGEVLVKSGDEWEMKKVEEIEPGERVRILPGERVALDGVVVRGESSLDESSVTGESVPASKGEGDTVFSGTLNQRGSLEIRVTRAEKDSTLARIVRLVEQAREEKANTQRFLEKAERGYAAGVILFTLALIFIPWKVLGEEFDTTFYRAMTVMVVASPCALIISTPAAYLSAIGGAARNGVLFKGGVHLERLASVRTVAFDKTGTLTRGKPVVKETFCLDGSDEDQILRIAASLESHSEHPLAEALLASAKEKHLPLMEVDGFESFPGKGVAGRIDGAQWVVGNAGWVLERLNLNYEDAPPALEELREKGNTLVVLGEESSGTLRGVVAIADEVRADAAQTVARLKRAGVKRVVMLTGDHPRVAQAVGDALGMDEVHAGLLPEDKVRVVKELRLSGAVAMVGDGVNDAPALALAHVGIAMGAAGTDVAMETADVVLMGENLGQLVHAFKLGKKTRRIVTQNLVFALGVIVVLVTLSLTVGIPLPLGVVGHEGSTVIVCLNGLRLLRFRKGNAE